VTFRLKTALAEISEWKKDLGTLTEKYNKEKMDMESVRESLAKTDTNNGR